MHLVVHFAGARLKCATEERCRPAEWNADKQKFRASYPLAEEANNLLARLVVDVLTWWRKLRVRDYSKQTLRQRLVVRNWLRDSERDKAAPLHPTTYDVATHGRVLGYLRFDRKLAEEAAQASGQAGGGDEDAPYHLHPRRGGAPGPFRGFRELLGGAA